MILDSSVLLHILLREAGWETTLRWLSEQPHLRLSAVSLVEVHAVVTGRLRHPLEGDLAGDLDELLEGLQVDIVPFDAEQARTAQQAYVHCGKGQGHPAQLNFGDVMVYALSKTAGEPLAFVGDDFSRTDLEAVRLPLR